MIPAFVDHGYLPPGIHPATLDEIRERFGSESEVRRVQMESLGWLVELSRRAGVLRLVINGSFTTDAYEPNDVDCALLAATQDLNESITEAEAELRTGLPFLDIHLVGEEEFVGLINRVFSTDCFMNPKGIVEIIL
jgi:hypothetical protein